MGNLTLLCSRAALVEGPARHLFLKDCLKQQFLDRRKRAVPVMGHPRPRNLLVVVPVFPVNPLPLLVMHKALLFSLVLCTLVACQKEDLVEAPAAPYPQTWQLVKLTGSIPG
jgi:hypothetical protein